MDVTAAASDWQTIRDALNALANPHGIVRANDPSMIRLDPQVVADPALAAVARLQHQHEQLTTSVSRLLVIAEDASKIIASRYDGDRDYWVGNIVLEEELAAALARLDEQEQT